jgi:hypothetical protein
MGVKRRLWVVKNRIVRITVELKGGEATEGWRKLQNRKVHDLYFSSDIISMVKQGLPSSSGSKSTSSEQQAVNTLCCFFFCFLFA